MTSREIHTHTRMWQVERRLYKLYDYTLPMPISLRTLAILAVAFIPWLGFVSAIGVPFAPPIGHLVWLAPPAVFSWWASKPVAEGKQFVQLLGSQIRYLAQPAEFTRLRPFTQPRQVHVHATVWSPHPRSTTDCR